MRQTKRPAKQLQKGIKQMTITTKFQAGTTQWTIDNETAKKIAKGMKSSKGSWEYANIVYPIRSALRKNETVLVYTEGFATGEFATKLANLVGYQY
jgi:hypothetical protein